MIQLAGHLRGKALQEWNLLSEEELADFDLAVQALRDHLDLGSKVLAAQEFRHTTQGESEKVTDYISRLERAFRIAYGKDNLSQETRHAMLFGQLHEGLRMELMRSPTVSGAMTYKELCMSARSEERRLLELRRRQQYLKQTPQHSQQPPASQKPLKGQEQPDRQRQPQSIPNLAVKRCYNCNKTSTTTCEGQRL